ncbi:MAG: hypothetical protein HKM04_03765 [Legionellales bacterium]|nr:hypothetical protein [Legionellales bacterium]
MTFCERQGYQKTKPIQIDEVDENLKNDIWTIIHEEIQKNFISFGCTGYGDSSYRDDRAKSLWTEFFHKKSTSLPNPENFIKKIEGLYDNLAWQKIYEILEFMLERCTIKKEFSVKINTTLEKNNSAYRVIENTIQPITCDLTILTVTAAHQNAINDVVKTHLIKAEKLYSLKNPDFNNSCLESIKAIESTLYNRFKNNKRLGENIKSLSNDKSFDSHICEILKKINAFRGDSDVAHAKKEHSYTPTREDAILIHTICCGFVNYFKSKRSQ